MVKKLKICVWTNERGEALAAGCTAGDFNIEDKPGKPIMDSKDLWEHWYLNQSHEFWETVEMTEYEVEVRPASKSVTSMPAALIRHHGPALFSDDKLDRFCEAIKGLDKSALKCLRDAIDDAFDDIDERKEWQKLNEAASQ